MNYAKMLGLLAVAATALMAFASIASATTGTDSAGGSPVEVGDKFEATNVGNEVLDGTINVTCTTSTISGVVSSAGDVTHTVSLNQVTQTLTNCHGNSTVTIIFSGTLSVHNLGSGNGTITSNGKKVTILTHNILGTIHCIYVTNETDVGNLDGSNNTGGTATWTIDSVPIPRESTDFGCGSTSELTGEYTISTPDYLAID